MQLRPDEDGSTGQARQEEAAKALLKAVRRGATPDLESEAQLVEAVRTASQVPVLEPLCSALVEHGIRAQRWPMLEQLVSRSHHISYVWAAVSRAMERGLDPGPLIEPLCAGKQYYHRRALLAYIKLRSEDCAPVLARAALGRPALQEFAREGEPDARMTALMIELLSHPESRIPRESVAESLRLAVARGAPLDARSLREIDAMLDLEADADTLAALAAARALVALCVPRRWSVVEDLLEHRLGAVRNGAHSALVSALRECDWEDAELASRAARGLLDSEPRIQARSARLPAGTLPELDDSCLRALLLGMAHAERARAVGTFLHRYLEPPDRRPRVRELLEDVVLPEGPIAEALWARLGRGAQPSGCARCAGFKPREIGSSPGKAILELVPEPPVARGMQDMSVQDFVTRCPDCGTFYLFDYHHEVDVNMAIEDYVLLRLTPDEAAERLEGAQGEAARAQLDAHIERYRALLEHPEARYRKLAAWALTSHAGRRGEMERVAGWLAREPRDEAVAEAVLEGVLKHPAWPLEALCPALESVLGARHQQNAYVAARLLARHRLRVGDMQGLSVLLEGEASKAALKSVAEAVREGWGGRRVVPGVLRCLRERPSYEVERALVACLHAGTEVPAILEAACDALREDGAVRERAAMVLKEAAKAGHDIAGCLEALAESMRGASIYGPVEAVLAARERGVEIAPAVVALAEALPQHPEPDRVCEIAYRLFSTALEDGVAREAAFRGLEALLGTRYGSTVVSNLSHWARNQGMDIEPMLGALEVQAREADAEWVRESAREAIKAQRARS